MGWMIHGLYVKLICESPLTPLVSRTQYTKYLLSFRFCTILDSSKSGKKLLETVRRSDIERDEFKWNVLPWKLRLGKMSFSNGATGDREPLRRPDHLAPFILDKLCDVAEKQLQQWNIEADSIFGDKNRHTKIYYSFEQGPDEDLRAPWVAFNNAVSAGITRRRPDADALDKDRIMIRTHVEKFAKEWAQLFKPGSPPLRQDTFRDLSERFCSFPYPEHLHTTMDTAKIALLRASCAYCRYTHNPQSPFPWKVAFGELCRIKAEASRAGFSPHP